MIEIIVLEEDREKAKPCVTSECLVAVAIIRQLGTPDVSVHYSEATIQGQSYYLDKVAIDLIVKYDSGVPLELPKTIRLTPILESGAV